MTTELEPWEVALEADALHLAAQAGDRARVEALLSGGADVNRFDDLGKSPLEYAAMEEHLDVVRLLLAHGADVNAHDESQAGDTALGAVAGSCSLELARLLLEAGADPTIRGHMQLNALDRAEPRKRRDGPQVYALLLKARARAPSRRPDPK